MKKVLVFDSGVGGFSIVDAICARQIPLEIAYLADTAYFPYGEKSDLDLLARIPLIVKHGVESSGADAVIIACNTASTIALFAIRELVSIPVIGVVPAIKPAATLSKTKTIGLLATPRTIGSAYCDQLIEDYAQGIEVLRYGPPKLARAAEDFIIGAPIDEIIIKDAIDGLLKQKNGANIDEIVLACTHYPLVKEFMAKYVGPNVSFVDSGDAIAKRLAVLLNLESEIANSVLSMAYSTGQGDVNFAKAALRWGFGEYRII